MEIPNTKMEVPNTKMNLSEEQQIAFDKYVSGHNIFITGPGGSGKSALIKKIKDQRDLNGFTLIETLVAVAMRTGRPRLAAGTR